MATVRLPTEKINDSHSFHDECELAFGFPGFYGRNMNAWIDCLSYLPEGDGMSRFELSENEKLFIHMAEFEDFAKRVPEISTMLLECVAAVNRRLIDSGDQPRLVLVLE